jgi:hypothetical protein
LSSANGSGKTSVPDKRLTLFTIAALALAGAAVGFTLYRLRFGVDLRDESFSVLTPWRWALGDRPFVDETNLAMMQGFLTYPFVKLYAIVGGNGAPGLFLYMRCLYLLFVAAVGACAFLWLRTQTRWQIAVAIAAVATTFVFWRITDLTDNTLAAGFLTLGFVLGLWVVVSGRGRRYALAAGICHGLAVIAYPTLLFIMPFIAIAFALSQGRQATAMIAAARWSASVDPRPGDPPTGRLARRTLIPYVFGGAATLGLFAVLLAAFGIDNVVRSWHFTMEGTRGLHQLGGATKAFVVARGLAGFIASQPLLLVALVCVYLTFRWRPRVGRFLLLLLPAALYVAGQRPQLEAAGLVLIYGLLAPYLLLFVPRERREVGAKLLIWVWAPAMVAAAMTGYTSTAGYAHGATGLYPAVVASGLFAAWALQAASRGDGTHDTGQTPGVTAASGAWLAFAGLAAVVAVVISLQFQYQIEGIPYGRLTRTVDFGPWWGLRVEPAQYAFLKQARADLQNTLKPGDRLFVYFKEPGLYFFWSGPLATNSTSLDSEPRGNALAAVPKATAKSWRRRSVVPDVVVHVCPATTLGLTTLRRCGGLQYPVAVVRSAYAINVRPSTQSTTEVLARLPR